MKFVLLALIKGYRFIKSRVSSGSHCRYVPCCSSYGLEAIEVFGAYKGFILTVWRILRCNPFAAGGFDPVPYGERKDRLSDILRRI